MTRWMMVAVLGLAMGLSACTRPDRFGGGDGVGMGGPGGAGGAGGAAGLPGAGVPGVGTGGLGGAGDPTSPAYFNQTVGDRVFFAVDQSTLSPEAIQTLDGQARWLQANPEYQALIEGHADEVGTREYNVALGARRANAVREYLVSKGIPGARIRTISYGKERPVATCGDESCFSQNRRAVTVISIASLS
ncbi:18K peptidoglycan-associated outer membrane lipoprotein [Rubellimicrobium mesophilum DSM 19309]|uniref:Peptidoglycan-associated lipoprotein n=1 Tax=Rubellimicrobium mesophilum DSM 19309 TaxID=442562 RepID=A0A017HUU6_9RHOB|nr:peptidoglycan-associated lipoprotein Pal [Rubellimicrobium mesophilum]EYD77933.1 18K peptidoglycan-associated outer membrane lipoprotein [Rubellimicrobium mesophilum DSM 19309]